MYPKGKNDYNELLQSEIVWEPYTDKNIILDNSIYIIKARVDLNVYNASKSSCLSPQEVDKANRFVHYHDRDNYIVRKYVLRTILSKLTGTLPQNISFSTSENKKPGLEGLHFNTSHSNNQILIALSLDPIGADIEFIDSNFTFTDLVPTCFNAKESVFINEAKSPHVNFYTLWTRKEAILKATGDGLVDDLPAVEILENHQQLKGYEYNISSYIDSGGYVISVASSASKILKYTFYEYFE